MGGTSHTMTLAVVGVAGTEHTVVRTDLNRVINDVGVGGKGYTV